MAKIGTFRRVRWMDRDMAQSHPNAVFLYGDNMARTGRGGQAKYLRDEPNALGVPTKWRPSRNDPDYFTNDTFSNTRVMEAISKAFDEAEAALKAGKDVYMSEGGIGTGLAELPTRAPLLFHYIEERLTDLAFIGRGR
jgi:hypothetical protein